MRNVLRAWLGASLLLSTLAVASEPPAANSISSQLAQGKGISGMVVADGWKVVDLEHGHGDPAQTGAWVRFHYVGWFHDPKAPEGKGEQFDSSADRGEPFVFQLGKQRVIMGWEAGLLGMRAGGKRRLIVPPALGFGDKGAGGKNGAKAIPANSTLVFDVELIDFLPPIAKP